MEAESLWHSEVQQWGYGPSVQGRVGGSSESTEWNSSVVEPVISILSACSGDRSHWLLYNALRVGPRMRNTAVSRENDMVIHPRQEMHRLLPQGIPFILVVEFDPTRMHRLSRWSPLLVGFEPCQQRHNSTYSILHSQQKQQHHKLAWYKSLGVRYTEGGEELLAG
jgi:hypothetical protein